MSPKSANERASHLRGAKKASTRVQRAGKGAQTDAGQSDDLSSGAVKMKSALGNGRISKASANATNRSVARHAQAGAAQKGHSRSRLGVAVFVVALVVAVLAVASLVVPRFFGGQSNEEVVPAGTEVTLSIPDGSGATEIATLLHDSGVISSTADFLREVDRQDAESSMQSGSYVFVAGDDVADVVALLVSGPNNTEGRLTIPEGYTVSQIASAVETTLGIASDSFVAQAKASNYVADYPFLADAAATDYDSLEGFLFPKTYDFTGQEGVTADAVIRSMLDQYQAELESVDLTTAKESLQTRFGIEFSDYDVLTVASIVEKETNTPGADGAHVASVIYNRLAAGILLQCDSTSVYANGGTLTLDIVSADWDNPYNTYRYTGLPPTPICSPSIEAVNAALSPDVTDDYYFFISGDYHVFSQTYEEHEQAIADAPSGDAATAESTATDAGTTSE